MVIERWHGVQSESRVRNRIVSVDPLFGVKTGAEPDGRSRYSRPALGDLETNSIQWLGLPTEIPCPLAD
jgi:hypothetical protein